MTDTCTIYNKETIWNRRIKPPVVGIAYLSGRIRFSAEAVKLLSLKENDCISIMIDERDRDIFYFFVDNKKGMRLYKSAKKDAKYGIGLQVCCKPLSRKILAFMRLGKVASFDVTNEKCNTESGKMWFIRKGMIHKPMERYISKSERDN